MIELSPPQYAAIDRLPEDAVVVGVHEDTPVIRRPDGPLVRITTLGRTFELTGEVAEFFECRVIDMLLPKLL